MTLGCPIDTEVATTTLILSHPGWIREAIYKISTGRSGFGGLSLLYAGDRLIRVVWECARKASGTIGSACDNSRMAKYSPGLILLLKMAEHAPQSELSGSLISGRE